MKTLILAGAVAIGCAPFAAAAALDASYYGSLDLNRAAQANYGPTAYAVAVGDHLWDWRAYYNGQYQNLDLNAAVQAQYGSSYTLVAVGVGKYDWRVVDLNALPYAVLPVMEVANDRFFDVSAVAAGIANFESVLEATRNWYSANAGKSPKILKPIVIYTSQSSQSWNTISNNTQNAANRYDLLNQAIAEYQSSLPTPPSSVKVAMAPYTGASSAYWYGAAGQLSGQFVVSPPRGTSVSCPVSGAQGADCADAEYAFGHEFGHTLGLNHACDDYPSYTNCGDSIMQTGKPWNAILLPPEIGVLSASPFLY